MRRADSLEKLLMLGQTWGQEKGAAEDEMVGWHHWLNGHECEQTPGNTGGQGSCPTGCKQSDKAKQQQQQMC